MRNTNSIESRSSLIVIRDPRLDWQRARYRHHTHGSLPINRLRFVEVSNTTSITKFHCIHFAFNILLLCCLKKKFNNIPSPFVSNSSRNNVKQSLKVTKFSPPFTFSPQMVQTKPYSKKILLSSHKVEGHEIRLRRIKIQTFYCWRCAAHRT